MPTELTPLRGEKRLSSSLLARATVCVLAVAEGYDYGSIGGVVVVLEEKWQFATWQVSWLVGVTYIALSFGALPSGWFADRCGRRPAMAVAYVLLTIGALMLSFAEDYTQLFVGRMVQGLGCGAGLSVMTTYMSEVAPAEERGRFPSILEAGILFGVMLGYVADDAFLGLHNSWRWITGLGAVLPAICLSILAFGLLPESPRFLYMQGEIKEAETVLREFVSEEEVVETIGKWEPKAEDAAGWYEVMFPPHPYQRRAFLASFGVIASNPIAGTTAFAVYTAMALSEHFGTSDAFGIVLATGMMRSVIVGTTVFYLIDTVGRRRLLMVSTGGIAASYALVALGCYGPFPHPWALKVGGVVGMFAFHALGVGPVPYVFAGEVLDTRLRSKSLAICVFASRLYLSIIMMTFLRWLRTDGLGPIVLALSGANLCSFIFMALIVPETKGIPLEDIHQVFS